MAGDPASLEVCNCCLAKPVVEHVVDLTEDSAVLSSDEGSSNTWLSTALYTLHADKKQEILSPDGWLSDTVIKAAQLLILQEFPHIAGLQDPAVHKSLSFQILTVVTPAVQLLQIQEVHPRPHSNACNFWSFLSIFS